MTTRSTISRLYGPHSLVHEKSGVSSQRGWNPSPVWNWFDTVPLWLPRPPPQPPNQSPFLSRHARGMGFLAHMEPAGEVPALTVVRGNGWRRPSAPPQRNHDVSPSNASGVCWKQSSVRALVLGHSR